MAAQQGETLAAGLSAPTLIVVADLNRLQVDAFVDETDIGKVKLRQDADITVDAFPTGVFKGKVVKIASGSTIQQGVVTYDVTIALDNKMRQLDPDMTAGVTIQIGVRTNVLLVPSEAVKAGKLGVTVNVMTKKNGRTQIEQRSVKTGGTDGVNTEIRDGLKEGDIVVLAGNVSGQKRAGGASPFGPSSGGGGRGGGGG
jgi:multidrug efflux pump subunit AcrA (membrane-fusion protein)